MAKILLIEDDPLVIRMYQKILSFEGFEIEFAVNGRDGVIMAKEVKPNLIFCDVMMPQMNGIEVLEHLKADPETSDIPVIMLTNLSGTHDAEMALQKGAFAYMVKSEYKPKEVAAKAKELLISFSQQKEVENPKDASAIQTPNPNQEVPRDETGK